MVGARLENVLGSRRRVEPLPGRKALDLVHEQRIRFLQVQDLLLLRLHDIRALNLLNYVLAYVALFGELAGELLDLAVALLELRLQSAYSVLQLAHPAAVLVPHLGLSGLAHVAAYFALQAGNFFIHGWTRLRSDSFL